MPSPVNRRPLVLIPGLLCSNRLWQPQIDAMRSTAECWVVDPTRHEEMGVLAATLLQEIPFPRFALAGLSMGGYVALEIMRQAPDRVTQLALLSTTARPDSPEKTANRRRLMALADHGRFAGVSAALLPQFIHPSRLGDAALSATIRDMAQVVGKDAFLRQQRAIMSRRDSRPHLGAIRCATLVLCGRGDVLTPLEDHEEIARLIPGATLEVIGDCGHLGPLERPEAVSGAMRAWLV